MLNRYITFYKIGMQFVVFLALLSMCFVFGGFVIEQINHGIAGMSANELVQVTDMSKELADKMKMINAILLVMVLLLPALLFAYLAFPSATTYLGFQQKSTVSIWFLAFFVMLIATPFSFLLEQWNSSFSFLAKFHAEDERINNLYISMLKGKDIKDLLLNTLMICLAPAIIEEVFFRGCLQQLFSNWLRKNQWVGVVVVAIIFSAFHGQMSAFIPRLFLGLLLGLIYHYTSNLWITIFLHFLNNFSTILMMYLFNNGLSKINPMNLPPLSSWIGMVSGLATIGLVYYFYTIRKKFLLHEVEKDDNLTGFLTDVK